MVCLALNLIHTLQIIFFFGQALIHLLHREEHGQLLHSLHTQDKNVSFRPEYLDPSVDHHPERLRIHQDEKREAMTNLELEFDITLPNRESIVPLLISRFSTQQPSPDQIKDFERFLRGVSKCSAANGGPSIDGVVE